MKKSRVDEVYAKTWLLLYTRNVPVQSWLKRYHVYAHACTPVRNGGVARACEAIVGFKVHEADLCVMLQMFSCEFQLFQYTDHFRYIMPIGAGAAPSLHPIPFHLGKSCNDVYLGSE